VVYQPFTQAATGWTWGNGSSYGRSFDQNGHVSSVTLGPRTRSYAYDAAGRVQTQSDSSGSSTFGYDQAGHLISYAGPGASQSFTYDVNGNRIADSVNGVSHTYTINTNRLVKIDGANSYTYNAGGTPSSSTAWTYTWDAFGRLARAERSTPVNGLKLSYTYNGLGRRDTKLVQRYFNCTIPHRTPAAAKATGAASPNLTCTPWRETNRVTYVYDDQGHLIGQYDSDTGASQETVWFNGQPVATVQGGVVYYVSADNLGSPRSIVRASDNVELWRWDSDPFGVLQPTNPNPGSGSITYDLRFPGQVFDVETQMASNGMRDYVPATGRYLEPDPIGLGGGLSRYAYAGGNPTNHSDVYGLLSVVAQGGASIVRGLGGEGYLGIYITLPSPGINFDIGVYASGGLAGGYNVGSGWGLGLIKGDQSSISGITYNVNGGMTPVGGTLMYDNTGLVGGVVGPAAEEGASGSYARTGAFGLSDIGTWIGGKLFNIFGPSTCPVGH